MEVVNVRVFKGNFLGKRDEGVIDDAFTVLSILPEMDEEVMPCLGKFEKLNKLVLLVKTLTIS